MFKLSFDHVCISLIIGAAVAALLSLVTREYIESRWKREIPIAVILLSAIGWACYMIFSNTQLIMINVIRVVIAAEFSVFMYWVIPVIKKPTLSVLMKQLKNLKKMINTGSIARFSTKVAVTLVCLTLFVMNLHIPTVDAQIIVGLTLAPIIYVLVTWIIRIVGHHWNKLWPPEAVEQ